MATVTLNYDGRNVNARKMLEALISVGLFQKAETQEQPRYSRAMIEKVRKGREDLKNGKGVIIDTAHLWD